MSFVFSAAFLGMQGKPLDRTACGKYDQ